MGLRGGGLVAGALASAVVLAAAARDLSVEGFGILAIASSIALVIQGLDLGTGAQIVNQIGSTAGSAGQRLRMDRRWYGIATVRSVAAAVFITLVYGAVAGVVGAQNDGSQIGTTLGWTSLAAVGASVSSLSLSALLGAGRVRAYYRLLLVQPLATVSLLPLVHYLWPTVIGYALLLPLGAIAAGLAARAATNIGSRNATVRVIRYEGRTSSASSLATRQTSNLLAFTLTPALVGALLGATAAAQYAIPHRLYLAAWSVVGVVYSASWPAMARLRAESSGPALQELRVRVTRSAILLAFLACLGIATAGPWVGETITGDAVVTPRSAYLVLAFALLTRAACLSATLFATAGAWPLRFAVIEMGLSVLAMAVVVASPTFLGPALLLAALPVLQWGLLSLMIRRLDTS